MAFALAIAAGGAGSSFACPLGRGAQELGVVKAQAIIALHGAAVASALALALAKGIEGPIVNLGLHWCCGLRWWLLSCSRP